MEHGADRHSLVGDLARGGYLIGDFVRGGGRWFQSDLVLTRPGILARCADLLAEHVPPETDRIAARGVTAIALATALSLRTDAPLLLASPSAAGDDVTFRGDAFPGARIVLLEDVVLTGKHAAESNRALEAAGYNVILVLGLLDRGAGGRFILEGREHLRCSFAFRDEDLLR